MLERVFLQVLRLSILACPLFVAIMIMRLALRRAPKWIRCTLWGLLALRLVCPFSLPSALSLQPSQARMDQTVADMTRSDRSASSTDQGGRRVDIVEGRAGDDGEDTQLPTVNELPITGNGPDLSEHQSTGIQPAAPDQTGSPQPAAETGPVPLSRAGLMSRIWLAGMAAVALYGLGSWLRLRRRVRTAVRWRDNLWQCETVDTPFVLGLVRPRFYLPFRLDPDSAAQIIAHERAHIRRRDPWTKLLAYALLAVYWFHPAVWAAYWLLGQDIELACDERVIKDMSLSDRQRYASALLEWGTEKPALPACPLAFGEVGVGERIVKVMKYKKPARWAAALGAVLAVVAAVCFLTDPAEAAGGDVQPPAPLADAEVTPEPVISPEPTATPEPAPERYTAALAGADGNTAYEIDAPWPAEAPEAAPVLSVSPRDFTVEDVQAVVKAIFADAEVYEYEEGSEYNQAAVNALLSLLGDDSEHTPEAIKEKYVAAGMDLDQAEQGAAVESEMYENAVAGLRADLPTLPETADLAPCAWTFYPQAHYDSDYAGEADAGRQYLEANAWLDGLSYHIRACNKPVTDSANYRVNMLSIWPDHSGYGVIPCEPFDDQDRDAALDTVRRILTDAGLDKYQIAEVYDAGYPGGGLQVVCLPAYENIRQAYMQDYAAAYSAETGRTTYGEYIYFSFCAPGRLYSFDWYTPQIVTAAGQPQTMLTLDQAMDAFRAEAARTPGTVTVPVPDGNGGVTEETYPRDAFSADQIVFGYVRLTEDGAGDGYALVPCWALLGRNDQTIFHGPLLAVSAVNGAVIRTGADMEEVRMDASLTAAAPETEAGGQPTPSPTPQLQPTPSPTPRPAVVELEVRQGVAGQIDYAQAGYFVMSAGASIDLTAIWYPQVVSATPEWTVDDASVMTVQPDDTGITCHCEMVGQPGDETILHVKVNEMEADIAVTVA